MSTRFKELPPFEAWEDAEMRSVAFGVAGFFIVGALQAVGAISPMHRDTLAPVSGMVSAFLIALTLSLAYYHKRWMLGIGGAALFLILPLVTNLLWVRISGRSLIYPTIALGLLGIFGLQAVHRRISGPQWVDPLDEELRNMMEDKVSNFTWVDRVTWLCFVGGAIVLLILLVR
jgi:hypothetical protein